MHRLVAYAQGGVQRFVVDRPEMTIGSDDDCDICLPYAGVGRSHARLRSEGSVLTIEDVGARKGVLVNGQRVRDATALNVLDEIRLGQVALLVEDVAPRDVATDARNADSDSNGATAPRNGDSPTPRVTITAERFLEHIAGVSRWVQSDSASSRTLESLLTAVLDEFGGGVIFLFQGSVGTPELEMPNIKFVVASEARWLTAGEEVLAHVRRSGEDDGASDTGGGEIGSLDGEPAWIAFQRFEAHERPYLFAVALPRFDAESWSPMAGFRTLGDLLVLGLVHHVGQFQPIVFSQREQPDLNLAPGLVLGESPAMKRVLEHLRMAVEPSVSVLLRGESGVSKALLARSLHLSGPRRDGPFVTALAGGLSERQLEADLFGAAVEGKDGLIERDGKLAAADSGTLFIDAVDDLPMALQGRLVRFLRTGEVIAEGSDTTRPVDVRAVDVRLVTASRDSLEALVARDQFRVDLAYLLAQITIDVPALRDRREDLPLLVQAAINRCCHQAGKRVQGIALKALEALVVYDYPGNLPELESIVRRLVHLCPQGRPIDASMLPDAVRRATVKGLVADTTGDLDLERLVADCERAAIREALRRSGGNKSSAARALGLSRNGLAMKIRRLGLAESKPAARRTGKAGGDRRTS